MRGTDKPSIHSIRTVPQQHNLPLPSFFTKKTATTGIIQSVTVLGSHECRLPPSCLCELRLATRNHKLEFSVTILDRLEYQHQHRLQGPVSGGMDTEHLEREFSWLAHAILQMQLARASCEELTAKHS
jgi:hypothetical protein